MSDPDPSQQFAFFNEVGIIAQLNRAYFENRLPEGVLMSHFSVLNHLIRVKDGRTPLELANAFQVPKTTMTHTLAGLESHEWIEMRPNPSDGRSKQVWLTDAGRDFRNAAITELVPDMALWQSLMPEVDFGRLASELGHIRKVLDKARS